MLLLLWILVFAFVKNALWVLQQSQFSCKYFSINWLQTTHIVFWSISKAGQGNSIPRITAAAFPVLNLIHFPSHLGIHSSIGEKKSRNNCFARATKCKYSQTDTSSIKIQLIDCCRVYRKSKLFKWSKPNRLHIDDVLLLLCWSKINGGWLTIGYWLVIVVRTHHTSHFMMCHRARNSDAKENIYNNWVNIKLMMCYFAKLNLWSTDWTIGGYVAGTRSPNDWLRILFFFCSQTNQIRYIGPLFILNSNQFRVLLCFFFSVERQSSPGCLKRQMET